MKGVAHFCYLIIEENIATNLIQHRYYDTLFNVDEVSIALKYLLLILIETIDIKKVAVYIKNVQKIK